LRAGERFADFVTDTNLLGQRNAGQVRGVFAVAARRLG
jgi:hypothetical protein